MVGKRQALRVALHTAEIELPAARERSAQHGVGQIDPGIAVLLRQERQIQAGADAAQEHACRRLRQGGETSRTLGAGGRGQRRIVERREQRVAVLEAQ